MDEGDRPPPEELGLRFIRDEPATEDTFLSHKPLAVTVAKAIRGVPDLEVVGLVGEWGSGKSTVAAMVRAELEAAKGKGEEFCCFEFDAWLHQSDTPRRAFLEAFINWLLLEKKYLIDEEIWQKKLAALAGQVEETDITTTPSLTIYGALVAGSFLLVPIGLRFVDSDNDGFAHGVAVRKRRPIGLATALRRATGGRTLIHRHTFAFGARWTGMVAISFRRGW